jgi:hypothetical protein
MTVMLNDGNQEEFDGLIGKGLWSFQLEKNIVWGFG